MNFRKFIFLIAALSVFLACGKGNAVKLEGRWRGVKASGVSPDQIGAANLFASTMELEFKGDIVSVHTGGDKQSGKFKVVSDDKKSVVITTDQDGPNDPQTITFVDDHTIEWALVPGKSIQFAKE